MLMPTPLLILAKVSSRGVACSSSDKPMEIIESVRGIAIEAAAVRVVSII
jgi:hypothetical protein